EDHLRILRYYRVQARCGSELDEDAQDACADLAPALNGLSRERVTTELLNLLAMPDPATPVGRMERRGVLAMILPEADAGGVPALAALAATEKQQGTAPNPLRRLAALLPKNAEVAEQVAARLRLSGAQRKRLVVAAARTDRSHDPRALAYRLGREEAIDRLLLAGEDISSLLGWEIPQLPLKGGEIVARGIMAGPEVARIMKEIERRWIAEGFPDRRRVQAILEDQLAR